MDHSPFRRLSPELRNEIYDLVSYNDRGVFIELHHLGSYTYEWRLKPRTCFLQPLALTEVCTEMRREARGAFLAVNNVSMIVPMLMHKPPRDYPKPIAFADMVKVWLKRLGPIEQGAIKTLELDVGTWHIRNRRNRVTETQLAKTLFGLGDAFNNAGIECIVWITVPELFCISSYTSRLFAIAFRITPPDTERLLAFATKGKLQEQVSRSFGNADEILCQTRLLALKAALEKLKRLKTSKKDSKAESRIRKENRA